MIPTYSNLHVKANFNYLLYNWNDTQKDGKHSNKSGKLAKICDIFVSLLNKGLGDALIVKDEHRPTTLLL